MDCLRSFTIGISQNRAFTNIATQIKNWGAVGNAHWIVIAQGSSVYTIQGFKRIDIYAIEMVGSVATTLGPNDGAIVEDWQFQVGINGQVPKVGGVIQAVPNDFAISDSVGQFYLGKYTNRVNFATPYIGCQSIGFTQFNAQGNNGENVNSINLDINIQFQIYYKFEGE
jgi:hypothetical protein